MPNQQNNIHPPKLLFRSRIVWYSGCYRPWPLACSLYASSELNTSWLREPILVSSTQQCEKRKVCFVFAFSFFINFNFCLFCYCGSKRKFCWLIEKLKIKCFIFLPLLKICYFILSVLVCEFFFIDYKCKSKIAFFMYFFFLSLFRSVLYFFFTSPCKKRPYSSSGLS